MVEPKFDRGFEQRLWGQFGRLQTMRPAILAICDDEQCECGHDRNGAVHPCRQQ